MGSNAIDSGTKTAASKAAQGVSATQASNAQAQNANSNAAYGKLLSDTSAAANPASLTTNGLNGTFQNAYNTEANATAQTAKNAVQTSQQAAASQGQGTTPSGYGADQARQAYQQQASTNASNYSNLDQQQQANAINNYQYANTQLANYGQGQTTAATANNSGAAGTNTSLYGTASQQKPSTLGSIVSGAAGLGAAAITKYCWIAEAIYGEEAIETAILRAYLSGPFMETRFGKVIMWFYGVFGQALALRVKGSLILRSLLRPIFDMALVSAVEFIAEAV